MAAKQASLNSTVKRLAQIEPPPVPSREVLDFLHRDPTMRRALEAYYSRPLGVVDVPAEEVHDENEVPEA